jgi:hypothetical protein
MPAEGREALRVTPVRSLDAFPRKRFTQLRQARESQISGDTGSTRDLLYIEGNRGIA